MSVSVVLSSFLRRIGQRGFKIMFPIEPKRHKYAMKPNGFTPTWIVIHHSLSADGQTRNWDAIRNYHMSFRHNGDIVTPDVYRTLLAQQSRGLQEPWRDVGYHFGIENENGKIVVLPGRMIGDYGAHAVGFNDISIGICLVGNYDLYPPSEDRLSTMASLCRQLQIEFGIPRDHVIGHRETFVKLNKPVEKSCPGKFFDMDKFRERLRP